MASRLLDDDDGPGWITTFADLVTLLLVFFVLLFTMSSVEAEKFAQAMKSIHMSLEDGGMSNSLVELTVDAPTKSPSPLTTELDPSPPKPNSKQAQEEQQASDPTPAITQQWRALAEQLQSTIADKSLANEIDVDTPIDGTIVIQVKGQALFDSGSTTLNTQVDQVLDKLLKRFKEQYDFTINIQGHTDNLPLRNSRYESNWELSALRATTVLRYFIRQGISPKRLTATGYGDSVPIDTNETAIGRANNRRIEFVLERNARISQ